MHFVWHWHSVGLVQQISLCCVLQAASLRGCERRLPQHGPPLLEIQHAVAVLVERLEERVRRGHGEPRAPQQRRKLVLGEARLWPVAASADAALAVDAAFVEEGERCLRQGLVREKPLIEAYGAEFSVVDLAILVQIAALEDLVHLGQLLAALLKNLLEAAPQFLDAEEPVFILIQLMEGRRQFLEALVVQLPHACAGTDESELGLLIPRLLDVRHNERCMAGRPLLHVALKPWMCKHCIQAQSVLRASPQQASDQILRMLGDVCPGAFHHVEPLIVHVGHLLQHRTSERQLTTQHDVRNNAQRPNITSCGVATTFRIASFVHLGC
mmetsp:Transcript_12917/g.35070  ORF Transcript_12917/g.35070 Transcript_12917/m.35070 type:complete len:326 (-) Transcript_12917:743-1720(-)